MTDKKNESKPIRIPERPKEAPAVHRDLSNRSAGAYRAPEVKAEPKKSDTSSTGPRNKK